ncbi:50S ribosomal protein L15 [Candidatus Woesearchaeota archaeon]|nr:50S ribosomal protein L15 [Candidatus Woesearchaeota archaeon]|tara:strand:+ start:810 stop:1310 length:501 start_codon:yes stop_codon:yes gene_type:complete
MPTQGRTPKKNIRQRGSKTHGWGAMKKHRGAGNRGGRGNAGSGKRGDAKKPCFWKLKVKPKGFSSKSRSISIPINLTELDKKAGNLLKKGLAKQEGDALVIDLKDIGFSKLLGTGNTAKKFKIRASSASQKAVEKVKAAGGEVLLPQKKAEPAKEAKPAPESVETS